MYIWLYKLLMRWELKWRTYGNYEINVDIFDRDRVWIPDRFCDRE